MIGVHGNPALRAECALQYLKINKGKKGKIGKEK